MPFWKGEGIGRTPELGRRLGAFWRELSERMDEPGVLERLTAEFPVDASGAWNILEYARRQRDSAGGLPTDRKIIVEGFRDELGDPRIVIHSQFGRRVNGLLGLYASRKLRMRTGVECQMLYNDDGVLLRSADLSSLPLDILDGATPEEAQSIAVQDIIESAVFAGHFRQNAARALLLPRLAPGKRTPLWLQRMRAGDLLQIVRTHRDFPIVIETMREVMNDVLDLPAFLDVIDSLGSGRIAIEKAETEIPSPFSAGLLFDFLAVQMYAGDASARGPADGQQAVSQEALQEFVGATATNGGFRTDAIRLIDTQLQHSAPGRKARTVEELMQIILQLGDLQEAEILERCSGNGTVMIRQLATTGRITSITVSGEQRWVASDYADTYGHLEERRNIESALHRYLRNHGPVPRTELMQRYAIPGDTFERIEAEWQSGRDFIKGSFASKPADSPLAAQWCYRPNLDRVRRQHVSLLRKEITPSTLREYTLFLQRWTRITRPLPRCDEEGLFVVLRQLQGLPLPVDVWERDILLPRFVDYDPTLLDALTRSGEIVWKGCGPDRMTVALRDDDANSTESEPPAPHTDDFTEPEHRILEALHRRGASFFADLRRETGLSLDALNSAVASLFWRGLVSNDALNEMRNLKRSVHAGSGPIEPGTLTSPPRNPHKARVMGKARKALRQVPGWSGRWFRTTPSAPVNPTQMLQRYGVLPREFLDREAGASWTAVARQLELDELRGGIRRGYFVEGFAGMQFALPEAASAIGGAGSSTPDVPVLLAAADPANPFGGRVQLPEEFGQAPSRINGNYLAFLSGSPLLILERYGNRVRSADGASPEAVRDAMRAFLQLMRLPEPLRPFSRMVIESWNGVPPGISPWRDVLKDLGFQRERDQHMTADLYSV
jgi:ATP-dependent Lhr-like helicase